MAKITGSFNIANNTQDTTNYYFLTDGSTGIVGTGALLAPTSNNPVVTFSFSNANSAASLTNSGTIKATANRALYASGLKSGDSITLTNTSTGVILGSYAAKGVSGENNDAFKVKSDFSGGSVTIKLEASDRHRIAILAAARKRTPHYLMKEAMRFIRYYFRRGKMNHKGEQDALFEEHPQYPLRKVNITSE